MKIDFGRIHKTRPHLFADTVEIFAAFAAGGPVSKTDVITLIDTSVIAEEDLLDIDQPDLDDNDHPDGTPMVNISEAKQGYADDCFLQLEYRQRAFGDSYPFFIKNEMLYVQPDLSDRMYLYLFLLAASRSRTFKEVAGLGKKLADSFEEICRDTLYHLMNGSAEVVMFGPNSQDRNARFDSNLRKAIPLLASFMGAQIPADWRENDEAAQGDGKLDLIGCQKLDDLQGGWNVYLGQCAAQEDEGNWEKKRQEAVASSHRGRFHFHVDPQSVLFIPVCFRNSDGNWARKNYTAGVIVMDRLRIMLRAQEDDPGVSVAKELIEKNFSVNK